MEKKHVEIVISLLLVFSSCTIDQQVKYHYDYLVFGKYYGECIGENCVNIYKIADNKLFKDTAEILPTWVHPYQASCYAELPDSLYRISEQLLGSIPDNFLADTTIVYGQPDAGDWGGYYVEAKYDNKVRYFLLDTKKENIPKALNGFQDELESIIDGLNSRTNK